MSKTPFLILACVLVLAFGLRAQEKKEQKTLKDADIVLMSQNHIDDDTLIKLIGISATDFDLSRSAVLEMRKQGVSAAVLRAMLQATQLTKISAEASATPAPGTSASTAPPSTATDSATSVSTQSPLQATPPPPNSSSNPSDAESAKPAAPPASNPPSSAAANPFAGMPGTGAIMGMSPQQMAQMSMMRSQMATMGPMLSGLMGGMSPTSYSAEQMPHVFLKESGLKASANSAKQEVSPSMAQIAQSKFKSGSSMKSTMLRSLATEGLSFAAMGAGPGGMMAMSAFRMASGFMPGMRPGGPSLTYVWGLPGHKSSREVTDPAPLFELSYGDIPGIDPDQYEPALVKLVQTKDNYRLVGATQTKLNSKSMKSGFGPENGKWINEERCLIRIDKEERGFYVLRIDQPLEPGEYAVVLRPAKGYKASPSAFGGGAQVFYSAWDFSVPGGASDEGSNKKKK